MTAESVASKIGALCSQGTNGYADAKRLIQHVASSFAPGPILATLTFTGCFLYLEKACNLRALRIYDKVGVAADGGSGDYIVVTVGYNDGSAGAITPLGHWDTRTAQEGALVALTRQNMHGVTDPTAIPAGSSLVLTLASVVGGAANDLVVEYELDIVG
jgi:hypothetical protein